jgi:hypothetical protein
MALQTINSIGVLSLAKMMAILYAFLGLLVGGIFSLFAILGAAIGGASGQDGSGIVGVLFGIGAVIILPVFYGCIGFIAGLVTAPIYNLAAKVVGGLEVDLS